MTVVTALPNVPQHPLDIPLAPGRLLPVLRPRPLQSQGRLALLEDGLSLLQRLFCKSDLLQQARLLLKLFIKIVK